jgi:CRISPR-associated protein (TIGR03986 family)
MGRNRRNNRPRSRRNHEQAWAPYNFVPLQREDHLLTGHLQAHDTYNGHSGYFDVHLTTKSPIFIRGMLTVDEKRAGKEAKDKPDFFSIDGQTPVIPGSSLHGMIRNLTEIVSFGKFHFISDKLLVYRSVFGKDSLAQKYRDMVTEELGPNHFMYPSHDLLGGYLKRGNSPSGWVIQPAVEHESESFILVDKWAVDDANINTRPTSVSEVWVCPAGRGTYPKNNKNRNKPRLELAETRRISKNQQAGYVPATLVIAGSAPKRHWYTAIYAPDNDASPIPISKQIWESFVSDRDLQRGIPNRTIKDEDDPVFYLLKPNGSLRFFGPTMFFRVPYKESTANLVPDALHRSNKVDYAEALFGYVSEEGEKHDPVACAGRVAVTSARVTADQKDFYHESIPLKILGSPKPTTFQHYVEQPNGKDTTEGNLHHYDNKGALIRGHKLYWRQPVKSLSDIKERDEVNTRDSTQHTHVKPLRAGVTFTFRIYFDNLTDAEVGVLAWVLDLGKDPQARHQIGMGKPLGMGIVQLESQLTLTEREKRYRQLFDSEGHWSTPEQTEVDTQGFVTAFKEEVQKAANGMPFDDQPRIQELKHLLRKQTKRFDYMTIDNRDYDGRPVLPYPSEIAGS